MTDEPKHPLPRPYKETRPPHKATQDRVSPEKLQEIFAQHWEWVKTEGKEGEQADFWVGEKTKHVGAGYVQEVVSESHSMAASYEVKKLY